MGVWKADELAERFVSVLVVLSLCWIVCGKRIPLALGVGVFSGVRFRRHIPDTNQSDPITLNLDGKMVEVDRRFLQLSPDKQKETVEEIVNHLNAETAKRYAVYRSSPMLSTVISGSSHLYEPSFAARFPPPFRL
jgi:hypothetical protein